MMHRDWQGLVGMTPPHLIELERNKVGLDGHGDCVLWWSTGPLRDGSVDWREDGRQGDAIP